MTPAGHPFPMNEELEQEMKDAAILRDQASRVITGGEMALVSWIADGCHRNAEGRWRSETDRQKFDALRQRCSIYLIQPLPVAAE